MSWFKKDICWIVQENLGKKEDLEFFKNRAELLGTKFQYVKAIPFSDELPELDEDFEIPIFYGSTKFIENIKKSKYGKYVLGDYDQFNCEQYKKNYGPFYFNNDAKIIDIQEIYEDFSIKNKDKDIFVRPNNDDKRFNGSIMKKSELFDFVSAMVKNDWLSMNDKILVNDAFKIEKEWRFIVRVAPNSDYVSRILYASQYRTNHELNISYSLSLDVLEFVKVMARHWAPAEIFAMDVCLANGQYYVLECGNWHSVGFYDKKDMNRFFFETCEYFDKKEWK